MLSKFQINRLTKVQKRLLHINSVPPLHERRDYLQLQSFRNKKICVELVELFQKNKPILYNELKIISEANKNRIPDSYGEWINNNKTISIINRRLSTQDARSIANQPIFSPMAEV